MFWINIALVLPITCYGIGQPHYECGEHGRFEYCIDGIPGCVVGCHCHPGYYFDVESKICEPNAKLVQDYRRLYGEAGPTRVPDIFGGGNLQELSPTPTPSALDSHVDTIAKESEDLGDWLYNQFFKTIESQVINNTDTTNNAKPSRRSGNDKYPGKRSKNKIKGSKNKDKKTALRRKLLRISEDDSLFDESSDDSDNSDSSGSDDSNSDSDSGEDGSDCDGGDNDEKRPSSEHKDHKSFLWINKKPKAALPSFIFLPQLGTPFFPPLGLPAPPVPMFPMIPVPPVMMPNASCSSTTTTTPAPGPGPEFLRSRIITTPAPEVRRIGKTNEHHEMHNKNHNNKNHIKDDVKNDIENDDKHGDKKGRHKSHNAKTSNSMKHNDIPDDKIDDDFHIIDHDDDPDQTNTAKRNDEQNKRKKILKQLQDRMKSPKVLHRKRKQRVEYPDILTDEEALDSPMLDDAYAMDAGRQPQQQLPENVDFKYLAQLIHKMDNKTKQHKVNLPTRKNSNLVNHFYSIDSDDPSRRHFTNRRILESPNDPYYSNLGHQIASFIRNIDAQGVQTAPASLLPQQQRFSVGASQPVFSESSYMPRSYWERSVRSLLERYRPYDEEQVPFRKYDDNLFNLEKKVENYASTVKTLSLSELENVVFVMDNSNIQLQNITASPSPTSTPSIYDSPSNNDRSLNINLLPRQYENPKSWSKNVENYLNLAQPMSNLLGNGDSVNNVQKNLQGVLKNNFKNIPDYYSRRYYTNGNAKSHQINSNLTEMSRKEIATLQRMVGAKLKEVANSRNQLPKIPWLAAPNIANMLGERDVHLIANKVMRTPMNIKFQFNSNNPRRYNHNHPSARQYVETSNRYLHRNGILPMHLQVQSSSTLLKPQPSYFHHELQHLDFF